MGTAATAPATVGAMSLPGTLLANEPISTSITGARAWRVRYLSRDVRGRGHEVTGLVVAPAGTGADRPILTWCHGTTGLGDAACPSAQPDPARELVTYFTPAATQSIDYGVPGLQGLIDEGWVVCATDYQGLGTDGMHQYMVSRSNARDAVNIARAAAALPVGAGDMLGCMGWSQGGGAAAAVAELDADDFGDLRLVGTVAMSPAVTSVLLAHPTGPAAALSDAAVAPDGHLVMMFCGHHAAHPDVLDLGDVLTPLGVAIVEQAWNAQPVHHLSDTIARLFRLEGAILQPTPANAAAWQQAVATGSAAQRQPVCPVLVCIDAFGGGTVVPVGAQRGYIAAVMDLGGHVDVREYPSDDHFSLPQACVGDARAWLRRLIDVENG